MKDIRRPDFINAAMTSRSHSSIREMLIAILLFFIGTFAGSVIQAPAMFFYFLNNEEYINMIRTGNITTGKILDLIHNMPDWTVALTLCTSAGILVAAIIYCRIVEKRKAYSMGFAKKSCVFSYLSGLGLGALMVCLVYAGCMLAGSIDVDFTISGEENIPVIGLFFLGYLIQGMAEEALCRGFLLVSLTKRYTVFFSLTLSALFYSFFSGLNNDLPGAAYINLVLFGYFMGLLFLRFENIWFVGAFHGIWNFIQYNVFGMQSGTADSVHSLFSVRLTEGQSVLYGTTDGIDGGMMVSLVLLSGIVILTLEMRQKGMFVAPRPVENPYDKAYYEGFRQFLREKGREDVYDAYRNMQMGVKKEESQVPVNEDTIRNASNQKTQEEKGPYPTVFDQNYFKK